VAEVKKYKLDASSNSKSEPKKGRQIINADPYASVATTTKVNPNESNELEEGESIFHSHMWVKGTPLHFIIDSSSHKNLISVEVIEHLDFSTTPHM